MRRRRYAEHVIAACQLRRGDHVITRDDSTVEVAAVQRLGSATRIRLCGASRSVFLPQGAPITVIREVKSA